MDFDSLKIPEDFVPLSPSSFFSAAFFPKICSLLYCASLY
uniref:Uncharacterized protein n=1 Tax=Arundo donax TaxID=35708 RepID=A0A0A9FEQ5_ARUDO